jgi:hypothetical protein
MPKSKNSVTRIGRKNLYVSDCHRRFVPLPLWKQYLLDSFVVYLPTQAQAFWADHDFIVLLEKGDFGAIENWIIRNSRLLKENPRTANRYSFWCNSAKLLTLVPKDTVPEKVIAVTECLRETYLWKARKCNHWNVAILVVFMFFLSYTFFAILLDVIARTYGE